RTKRAISPTRPPARSLAMRCRWSSRSRSSAGASASRASSATMAATSTAGSGLRPTASTWTWRRAGRCSASSAGRAPTTARRSGGPTAAARARGGDAAFAGGGSALAHRPGRHTRVNFLGRYTFLYDLPATAQSVRADEKSHIVSAEAGYQVTRRWELGGRYALKQAEIRTERDSGSWLQSQPNLSVLRARYHLLSQLDAVGEYRWLWNPKVGDQQDGALLALYRNITSNVTLGAGFNATHFSDDLTDLDHDAYGWFVRLLGKY